MTPNPLVGKTITAVQLTSDKKAIRFILDSGVDIIAQADGDCCSSSWIEHVSLPARGFPATVLAVNDLDMPDLGSPNEYSVIRYYGCEIKTDKGDMVIDYRNESNGYYGGNLVWPGGHFYGGVYSQIYGGVYSQNDANEEWIDVKGDV